MDQQAANLLANLKRASASPESKLALLNSLKSDIKHYRVPDSAHATIFECLRIAISQQASSSITAAGFSTLNHLVKRLKIQDTQGAAIAVHAPRLWPALQERLGDSREGNRTSASQALTDLWPFCVQDVERLIRDEVISGTNNRAKEMGMQWVVKTHQEEQLQFKGFVPHMVTCLEDSDGAVRDAAKSALVELFRTAPDRAKADLKKQLTLQKVRQSISSQILQQIGISGSAHAPPPDVDMAASTRSLPALDHASHLAESVQGEDARPPQSEEVPLDPIFVHSHRELEDLFRDMVPHFEGRESEENWLLRDKDITKIRRLTKGNAPSEHHQAFMAGLKQLQEGTLKAANTLRTTMASNGCHLIQELARTLGPALDTMTEQYLQSFIKMSAATKTIASQNGNVTADAIFQYVSYNVRLMQHIWYAAQDKNKQPRTFSAGWLRTVLGRQAGSKANFESSGGLELAEKIIKKCLEDADPKVKESMRATYWTFAKIWPDRAERMINAFDAKIKLALEKDSHNPNASNATSQSAFGASVSSRASGARSALREKIAADRARKSKGQPPRPVTAMGTMSPANSAPLPPSTAPQDTQTLAPPPAPRTVSTSSTTSVATNKSTESASSTSSSATMRPNSLMSGAARRPVRRPELTRPATADPYAARRLQRPETPSNSSPKNSPRQTTTAKANGASNTAARSRTNRTGSPAVSPIKNPTISKSLVDSRPTSKDSDGVHSLSAGISSTSLDDFTMIIPNNNSVNSAVIEGRRRPVLGKTMSVDTASLAMGEDENFTMVMPNVQNGVTMHRDRSPLSHQGKIRSSSEEASGIPLPTSARSSLHSHSPPSKARSPSARPSPSADVRVRASPDYQEPPRMSVSRQGSPLKQTSTPLLPQEDVQIFEDPFTADASAEADPASEQESKRVLNELPIDSNQRPDSPPPHSPAASNSSSAHGESNRADGTTNGTYHNGTLSPPMSPQTKAEKLRSRKLLQSGIERIKARTLDTHGFRKVLELTRSNEPAELFGSFESRRFDELMGALCDYIRSPSESLAVPSTTKPGQTQALELKRQAIHLLRSLLTNPQSVYKKWNAAGQWHARSLTAALEARKTVEGLGLVVKDLESLTVDAFQGGQQEDMLETVIACLEAELSTRNQQYSQDNSINTKSAAHATALALKTTSLILSVSQPSTDSNNTKQNNNARTAILSPRNLSTIAALAARFLRSQDAEVRRASVELTTQLHALWPTSTNTNSDRTSPLSSSSSSLSSLSSSRRQAARDDDGKSGFWNALERTGGLQESTKNLIVYYIARREGRIEGR